MADDRWDWDPTHVSLTEDRIAALDVLRERCPVARSEAMGWSVLRHRDALTVLGDPASFSNRVSAHVAVPNGMDPPEHTPYRAIVDRALAPSLVRSFEPQLRGVAADVVQAAVDASDVLEVMSAIAEPFAARAQCAYLGWPMDAAVALQAWAADSARATMSRDRAELARVAERFDAIIIHELDRERRSAPGSSPTLTARLLLERVDGKPIADAMLVRMVRNWTAGELGTIAAAVGIVVAHLARDQTLQARLRAMPTLRQSAMDEMLRLDAPLIANRRRTTRPVTLGGRTIPADEPVTIVWPAVQRDPESIADPTTYLEGRDPTTNLLYGRGPHACPGEALARSELAAILDALLRALSGFTLASDHAPVRSTGPSGGFSELRIVPTQRSRPLQEDACHGRMATGPVPAR